MATLVVANLFRGGPVNILQCYSVRVEIEPCLITKCPVMGLCSIAICDTGTADCESISRVISDVEQNRQPKVVIDRSGPEEDWNVFSDHLDPPYCIQRAMYPINISPL